MARLQQYTAQRSISPVQGRRATADDFGNQAGLRAQAQASQQSAQGLAEGADMLAEIQRKRDEVEYSKNLSQFRLETMQRAQQLNTADLESDTQLVTKYNQDTQAQKNGIGLLQYAYMQDFEARAGQLQVPGSLKDRASKDLDSLRLGFMEDAIGETARREGVKARNAWENIVTNNANIVAINPSAQKDIMAELKAAAQNLNLDPVTRDDLLENAYDSVRQSAAATLAKQSPHEFIKNAKAGQYKDTPDLERFVRVAESEIERQEAKAAAFDLQNTVDSFATKTPQEISTALESRKPPDGPVKTEEDLKKRQEYDKLLQAVQQRNAQLVADPVAYTRNYFPDIETGFKQYEQDQNPETLQQALRRSLEEQDRLGLPFTKQRVLGPQAAQIVESFEALKPQEKLEQARGLKQAYGPFWGDAYSELVSAGLSDNMAVMLRMDAPDQRYAAGLLAEADSEKLEKIIPSETVSTIKDEVSTEIQEYVATTMFQPGNAQESSRVTNAVSTLAYQYTLKGMEGKAAARKAADEVINKNYDFTATARIPRQYNADKVRGGMDQVLSLIVNNENIEPLVSGSLAGTPDEIIREQYRKELQTGGYFITNAKEDGVFLIDRNGFNVMMKDGENIVPLQIKFLDLENLDTGEIDPVRHPGIRGSIREGF